MKDQLLGSLWLICLSIATGVAGQTAIKFGITQAGAGGSASSGLLAVVTLIFRSPFVFLGLLLYALGALAWIAVLGRLDLSLAYPFVALNFVLIPLASHLLLGESIPGMRWIGIACICLGVLIIARSASLS
jgi:drug/metabolite transporter (DMT)-like permease